MDEPPLALVFRDAFGRLKIIGCKNNHDAREKFATLTTTSHDCTRKADSVYLFSLDGKAQDVFDRQDKTLSQMGG